MGVKGLWQIVESVARPVELESLADKIVAVDASIWLYHFLKAMRGPDGEMLDNAPVIGFFRRICKLLFFRIRPVFVFDGPPGALKKETISRRRKRRETAQDGDETLHRRIITAKLKQFATLHIQQKPANNKNDTIGSISVKRKRDTYELPAVETKAHDSESSDDDYGDAFDGVNVDTETFKSLPVEKQYELLAEAKLQSRQPSWQRLKNILDNAPTALDFSKMQIHHLVKRNDLTQKLFDLEKGSSAGVEAHRIAAEKGREYVLVKNADNMTWTLSTGQESKHNDSKISSIPSSPVASPKVAHSPSTTAPLSSSNRLLYESFMLEMPDSIDTPEMRQKFHDLFFIASLKDVEAEYVKLHQKGKKPIHDEDSLDVFEFQEKFFNAVLEIKRKEFNHTIQLDVGAAEDISSSSSDDTEFQEVFVPVTADQEKSTVQKSVQPFSMSPKRITESRPMQQFNQNLINARTDELSVSEKVLPSKRASELFADVNDMVDEVHTSERLLPPNGASESSPESNNRIVLYTESQIPSNNQPKDATTVSVDHETKLSTNEHLQPTETNEQFVPQEEKFHWVDDVDERLDVEQNVEKETNEFARFISTLSNTDVHKVHEDIAQDINTLRDMRNKQKRDASTVTVDMIQDVQELLRLFGIPYITAPSEAESQLAKLAAMGIVDAIVTEDSDIFLFGPPSKTPILKNMFNQSRFVESYYAGDLENELALDRDKMIQLALLLGSDYTDGVYGVGNVTALEILAEWSPACGLDGLRDFRAWWEKIIDGSNDADCTNTDFKMKFVKGTFCLR